MFFRASPNEMFTRSTEGRAQFAETACLGSLYSLDKPDNGKIRQHADKIKLLSENAESYYL